MKRILLPLLCAALLGCNEDKKTTNPNDQATIVVGTSADYPPFEYFKDGEIVGFDVAMIKEIGKRMNMTVVVKDMSFDGILGSLQSKRIDASVASLTPTEERQKAVDFTDPYYDTAKAMICLENGTVKNQKDLTNQTVGVQSGSVHEIFANDDLSKKVENVQVKSLPRIPDLIQDLKAGRLACIIMGTKEAEVISKSTPDLKLVNLSDTKSVTAVALPKGSALKEKLNKALADMKKDGTLAKLKKEWMGD